MPTYNLLRGHWILLREYPIGTGLLLSSTQPKEELDTKQSLHDCHGTHWWRVDEIAARKWEANEDREVGLVLMNGLVLKAFIWIWRHSLQLKASEFERLDALYCHIIYSRLNTFIEVDGWQL